MNLLTNNWRKRSTEHSICAEIATDITTQNKERQENNRTKWTSKTSMHKTWEWTQEMQTSVFTRHRTKTQHIKLKQWTTHTHRQIPECSQWLSTSCFLSDTHRVTYIDMSGKSLVGGRGKKNIDLNRLKNNDCTLFSLGGLNCWHFLPVFS
jgi:hypothetical protein